MFRANNTRILHAFIYVIQAWDICSILLIHMASVRDEFIISIVSGTQLNTNSKESKSDRMFQHLCIQFTFDGIT